MSIYDQNQGLDMQAGVMGAFILSDSIVCDLTVVSSGLEFAY